MKIKLVFITLPTCLLIACGNNDSGSNNSTTSYQPSEYTLNRHEESAKIEGLNGQTLRMEDATLNSLPGNRDIVGLNGLKVTSDSENDVKK